MQTFPKCKYTLIRERHIERCDFSSLVELFDPENVIMPRTLRQHCDNLQILFCGYEHEQRLPFLIPEIRSFLRKLHDAWPYAPYFCDLTNSFLAIEALAQIEHFSVMEIRDSKEIFFKIDHQELARYLRQSHRMLDKVGMRAEMTSAQIDARKARVEDYIQTRLGPNQTS
jgi:hypothetical protein